jgi:uncharacterized membrane protein
VAASPDCEQEIFDFDAILTEVLSAIDIGPHCSCAEITLAVLERSLPLSIPLARCAAAAFGGGVGGSGGPCGAFAAGGPRVGGYAPLVADGGGELPLLEGRL